MDRKSKIEEIKNLFTKNKFQETIDKINELCKPEARPADLSCLSGVCKIIKSDPTEDEILSALQLYLTCLQFYLLTLFSFDFFQPY